VRCQKTNEYMSRREKIAKAMPDIFLLLFHKVKSNSGPRAKNLAGQRPPIGGK